MPLFRSSLGRLSFPVPLLGALLALAGCATPGDGAPEIREAEPLVVPTLEPDAAEAPPAAPLLPLMLFPGGADTFQAWRCMPAQDLVSAFADDELRLWSAHGAYRLRPAVVASGARFQQGDLSVWVKGDEARVESDNGRLDCTADATREALTRRDHPGVMFHARGNEPGWMVSLANDTPELTLLLDYGERELTLPYRVIEMENVESRVTLSSGRADHPFELELEARACFDSMSGKPYPARVTLEVEGETYRGCGQGIAPIPAP